jgi:hypothetical protein
VHVPPAGRVSISNLSTSCCSCRAPSARSGAVLDTRSSPTTWRRWPMAAILTALRRWPDG